MLAAVSLFAATPASQPSAHELDGLSANPHQETRIVAAAVRSEADIDDRTLIAGFVISGASSKSMLVRGLGPSLQQMGVRRPLRRPTLALHDLNSHQVIAFNERWFVPDDREAVCSTSLALGAAPLTSELDDSALLRHLPPGIYTANVGSGDAASGTALVELYDASPAGDSKLASVAARSHVGVGDDVLILGFALAGPTPRQVLVRGIGPTLRSQGVSTALENPQLTLFDRHGTVVATNDDWRAQRDIARVSQAVGAFPLPPDSHDAALLVTLPPGPYTAHVAGVNGTTGVALVELYDVPPSAQETRWTMVNVTPNEAQADCHLIEFPDGRVALIDVADAVDAQGAALAYLKSRDIRAVDLVVLSHFHADHYDRLRDVIEAGIQVRRVAVNLPAPGNERLEGAGSWDFDRPRAEALLSFLAAKQIPVFTPKAGERLIESPLGDGTAATLDVICLYDGVATPIGKTDVNDTSILVRLEHRGIRALFTGDLNEPLGAWLATSDFDLAADILKLPHHGTRGCAPPEFFRRVQPAVALVPSPRDLWFSERSRPIREHFAAEQIPTYVTGIHGHVTVTMHAAGYSVTTSKSAP